MKKLLFLLAFISTLASAQRTVVIDKTKFNYILYNSTGGGGSDTSTVYVVQLHGSGEGGPIDGSKIALVERYGYAHYAATGTKYPFKIVAPQAVKNLPTSNSNFKPVMDNIQAKLIALGAKRIIYMGWSLGAFRAIQTLNITYPNPNFDQSKITKVNGVFAFAGKPSGKVYYDRCLNVPIMLVHGTADNVVSYNYSKNMLASLLKTKTFSTTPVLQTITNGTHSQAQQQGWDKTTTIGLAVYNAVKAAAGY